LKSTSDTSKNTLPSQRTRPRAVEVPADAATVVMEEPAFSTPAASRGSQGVPRSTQSAIATLGQGSRDASRPATSQFTRCGSPRPQVIASFGRVTRNGPALVVTAIWMPCALTVRPNCGAAGTSWLSRTVTRNERLRSVAGQASPLANGAPSTVSILGNVRVPRAVALKERKIGPEPVSPCASVVAGPRSYCSQL